MTSGQLPVTSGQKDSKSHDREETMDAKIERGIVTAADGGLYTVASCDRDGIVAEGIAAADDTEYGVGDLVCFFLFADGTGKILCQM